MALRRGIFRRPRAPRSAGRPGRAGTRRGSHRAAAGCAAIASRTARGCVASRNEVRWIRPGSSANCDRTEPQSRRSAQPRPAVRRAPSASAPAARLARARTSRRESSATTGGHSAPPPIRTGRAAGSYRRPSRLDRARRHERRTVRGVVGNRRARTKVEAPTSDGDPGEGLPIVRLERDATSRPSRQGVDGDSRGASLDRDAWRNANAYRRTRRRARMHAVAAWLRSAYDKAGIRHRPRASHGQSSRRTG